MKDKKELEQLMGEAIETIKDIDIALSLEANHRQRTKLLKSQRDWQSKYQKARRVYQGMYGDRR